MSTRPVPYPASKHVLDKGVSLALLLVLVPVLAVLLAVMAVCVIRRPSDRGPLLYHERRISRGREFDLLKFRTVRKDVLLAAKGAEAHARMLEADSANLTWVGRRVLKPWYLDELPQLLNVLRGDMSLVGPRPWPPSMVANQVVKGFGYRNEVIAGWTGPAQVQKGVTEPAGYMELDLAYIETCRTRSGLGIVSLDLSILWQTVKVLAKGEGLQF